MAMVVKANSTTNVGGHISTYASAATLYEVASIIFFAARRRIFRATWFIFRATPRRAFMRARFSKAGLSETHLQNFRQELAEGGGLSSYPHPYLMPDFWQFPTVSMGLGPIMSIYQARFNRYLQARGLINGARSRKSGAFIGDGESRRAGNARRDHARRARKSGQSDLGHQLQFAAARRPGARQRQNHPGTGRRFSAARAGTSSRSSGAAIGTNCSRATRPACCSSAWAKCVDGDYQKYSVEPGSYTRKHFFGKYPELLELVNHLTDEQIRKLLRGGHDTRKVYAAYKAAMEHKGAPTVILAKTVKGYGLGEAGEGRNITHQQKKMNEKELREFRERFEHSHQR